MRDLLRSVWDEPRVPDPPVRVWWDWLLVGGLIGVVVLQALLQPELPQRWLWVAVLAALAPTLLWRRQRPLLVIVLAFGVSSIVPFVAGGQPDLFATAFFLVLPYALYRWGSGRAIVLGTAILLVSTAVSMVTDDLSIGDAIGGSAVLAAPITLGLAVRARAGARSRELEQVRLRERERLARDLHDTVAHHVSAMAVRAQAGLARSQTSPDAAADALRVIEAEASGTLVEMRSIVRVLRRDDHAELAPNPRIRDLRDLATTAGPAPTVAVDLGGDVDKIEATVATAVCRLVREAVANARRHARDAARVEVRVAVDDARIHVRVHDDGEPTVGWTPGYGVLGMRERADLLGGTCEAGPDPTGGWTVHAVLPRREAAS